MASPKLKLYFAVYSPFAQRVWIALNAKKVDFELIRINPRDKPPGYLSVNPRGLVPAIVDTDGRSMYESAICVEYIDETWPGDRLLLPGSEVYCGISKALLIPCLLTIRSLRQVSTTSLGRPYNEKDHSAFLCLFDETDGSGTQAGRG